MIGVMAALPRRHPCGLHRVDRHASVSDIAAFSRGGTATRTRSPFPPVAEHEGATAPSGGRRYRRRRCPGAQATKGKKVVDERPRGRPRLLSGSSVPPPVTLRLREAPH